MTVTRDDTVSSGWLSRDLIFTVSVTLIALLPRLFVAIAWAREPVWDGHYYHFGAQRIAEGLGYSEDVVVQGIKVWKPWSHYPVGYSALLGALYALVGSSIRVAPLANAVISALCVAFSHRVARHYVGTRRGRWAAGLVALHPGLIAYSALVMSELSAAMFILIAVWLATRAPDRRSSLIMAGLCFGLAVLIRPASLLAAPLIGLTSLASWRTVLRRGAIATALAMLVVLPWSIRNCIQMDDCAFVSTNAGWNLAIGAISESGRFQTLRAADGCPVVTGQVQQDRCWAKVGMEVISQDPVRWLGMIPEKLSHTFNHESYPIEYLHEADPDNWPSERRTAARELLTFAHRLLLAVASLAVIAWPLQRGRNWLREVTKPANALQLGLLGGILGLSIYAFGSDTHPFYLLAILIPTIGVLPIPGAPTQGPEGRILIGLIAVTAFTHSVFFGEDRYHMVISPILCILAAAALRPSGRARRERA